jgi:hypothetical protein
MILDLPFILETRRNHALEHATLHMLAHTHKINMAGHSNPTGFFIFGEVRTDEIRAAVDEAYSRLRSGEKGLAIHPGCGTILSPCFCRRLLPFQGVLHLWTTCYCPWL